MVLPEIFCLIYRALEQAKFVLQGLEADAARTRRNLDKTNGLMMSEAVMMGFGCHMGREYAYDRVYDLCRRTLQEDRPLIALLAEHPGIWPHVGRAELQRCLDPIDGTGQSGLMVDRVLAKQRPSADHAS